MVMLVSLDQASMHLRRDTDEDDEDLVMKIEGASGAVINYLKAGADFLNSSGGVDYDSAGDPIGVPKIVQIATLYLIGVLYKDRDGENVKDWELGFLPFPVICMLYPLRKPACV